VKSILDVPATLERLESLSVTVVGYRTDVFPGFYVRETQLPVPWRVEDPGEVARIHDANVALGNRRAVVVASPIAADRQMDPALHDRVLTAGLREMEERGVRGKDVTPFLLAYFHEHTGGASLRANVDLALANAHLGGQIAAAGARSRMTTES
jgi:pseudouridine-5'-phosphate glycosidase